MKREIPSRENLVTLVCLEYQASKVPKETEDSRDLMDSLALLVFLEFKVFDWIWETIFVHVKLKSGDRGYPGPPGLNGTPGPKGEQGDKGKVEVFKTNNSFSRIKVFLVAKASKETQGETDFRACLGCLAKRVTQDCQE